MSRSGCCPGCRCGRVRPGQTVATPSPETAARGRLLPSMTHCPVAAHARSCPERWDRRPGRRLRRAAARGDRGARGGRGRSRAARDAVARGARAPAQGGGGRLRPGRAGPPAVHEEEAQAGARRRRERGRVEARGDRDPRPAREAGLHDTERLSAEGLRPGGGRRGTAARDDRGAALLRLQAAVPRAALLLRPALPALRRVQLREALRDGRSRGTRRPAHRRARQDRLPGGHQAAARRARR